MPPPSQWMAMDVGISLLCFSSLSPRFRLVPLALLLLSPSSISLLSFVLPSSVWIRMFFLSSQQVLPVFTWSSVRTAASLDVLDASVERGVPHFHLPLCHLVHPICAWIRNEFRFYRVPLSSPHTFNFCFLRRTQVSSTLFSSVSHSVVSHSV